MSACPARSRVALVGSALVLVLVVGLPLGLALLSPAALHGDAGAGAGTGDLSAAALSALDRDLHVRRALPPHGRNELAGCLLLAPPLLEGLLAARREGAQPTVEPPLGGVPVGPTGSGHPLLL